MMKLKITNIAFVPSGSAESGGQIRVKHYNNALSSIPDILINQYSMSLQLFPSKKTVTHNDSYKEYLLPSFLYKLFTTIATKIFRIKRWPILIPLMFIFIPMPKKMRDGIKNADIIQVEEIWLMSWIRRYTVKPVVLIAHNIEYSLVSALSGFDSKKGLFRKLLMKYMFNTEKKMYSKADIIFCVSPKDAEIVKELYGTVYDKVAVVPNGVESSLYKKGEKLLDDQFQKLKEKFKKIILFTGSNYYPNVEAAEFITNSLSCDFNDEILFVIAGSVSPKMKKEKNVLYTGRIPHKELLQYFWISDIAINPMMKGSGTNIKMFEYMSAGLPIISTEVGLRGINQEGMDACICCNLETMSEKLKGLINSNEKISHMSRQSLELADTYDFKNIARNSLKYYLQLHQPTLETA